MNEPDSLRQQGRQAMLQGRADLAIALFEQALAAQPDDVGVREHLVRALSDHAFALAQRGDATTAETFSARAVTLAPGDFDALDVRGYVLMCLNRSEAAVDVYAMAGAINPGAASVWNSLGAALYRLNRLDEAVAAYDRALAIAPGDVGTLVNRAYALNRSRRYGEAAHGFEAALRRQPGVPKLLAALAINRAYVCDWRDRDSLLAAAAPRLGGAAMEAFESLALYDDPALHRRCAEATAAATCGGLPARSARPPAGGKIRVGYLSSDFHNHATAYLMAEVFERHDRSRFEVVAFSAGDVTDDAMQTRLRQAFDTFHDVASLSNAALANLIASEAVEIAVDLKGFTGNGRTAALAGRPAPVQVNFLGYPGTLGARFIDYIIADPVVIPAGEEPHYAEHVVRLPDSYQPNSSRPDAPAPSRMACGLPEDGVIFCSFNNPYKITPEVFDGWMRLLTATPGSVLWLSGINGAEGNLRKEATARGVAPERLVFAPPVPLAEHMARLGLADIVLDTSPYGAHTTASDALWAGVPIVTHAGRSFASRVAASLVRVAGVPELNRASADDAEAFALALAHDATQLDALRAKLRMLRTTAPLFDSARFTRNLEAAYQQMSDRARQGLPPQAFNIDFF